MENNEEQPKKKYRIGWFAIIFWVAIAIILDVITFFIPGLGGPICSIIFFPLFSLYLWKTKHGLINWKNGASQVIGLASEWIPAIQALPVIVVPVIIIIIMSRIEDKTGISIPLPGKKPGVTPPRIQRVPLNQGGVRAPR